MFFLFFFLVPLFGAFLEISHSLCLCYQSQVCFRVKMSVKISAVRLTPEHCTSFTTRARVASVSSQVQDSHWSKTPNERNNNKYGKFPPCTSTKKCQPQTCGATNKRLHTVFVLSSCGVSHWAAKVKRAPDFRRRLKFVMLVSRLLSMAPSHRLPLCCVSNTSSSSFICLFVQRELTPHNETAPHALGCLQVSHWKVWPNHSLKNYLYWFVFVAFTWSFP